MSTVTEEYFGNLALRPTEAAVVASPRIVGFPFADFAEHHLFSQTLTRITISGETPGVFAKVEGLDGKLVCGWRHSGTERRLLPILSPLQDTTGLGQAGHALGSRGTLFGIEGDFLCSRAFNLAWDLSEPNGPCYWLLKSDEVLRLLGDGQLEMARAA